MKLTYKQRATHVGVGHVGILTHSLAGAEQPRVGCISGDSVRKGSYRPLIGLVAGTHQKLWFSRPHPSVQAYELDVDAIVAEIGVVGVGSRILFEAQVVSL